MQHKDDSRKKITKKEKQEGNVRNRRFFFLQITMKIP